MYHATKLRLLFLHTKKKCSLPFCAMSIYMITRLKVEVYFKIPFWRNTF